MGEVAGDESAIRRWVAHKLLGGATRQHQSRSTNRRGCEILHLMEERNTAAAWRVGERVATADGFVAQFISFHEGRALIRYLGPHYGSEEILLPSCLLRSATAYDLVRVRIR